MTKSNQTQRRKTNNKTTLPTVLVVLNQDCTLCGDVVKLAKKIKNPTLFISSELMRYIQNDEGMALLATLQILNDHWNKFKVVDVETKRRVKEPVPFVLELDTGKSYGGDHALDYFQSIIESSGGTLSPDDIRRLDYLRTEYRKRKRIRS